MPGPSAFDYAVIRVVPRVEREEFINVGVILICREAPFLGARIAVDRVRLGSVSTVLDLDDIENQLKVFPLIAAGDAEGGEIAALPMSERFHWLVGPHSTIIQVSPMHSGITEDPETALDRLLATMVRPPKEIPPPKVEPEATPNAEPEATPNAEPQAPPNAEPETTPNAEPQAPPNAEPETTPNAEPEAPPKVEPQAT